MVWLLSIVILFLVAFILFFLKIIMDFAKDSMDEYSNFNEFLAANKNLVITLLMLTIIALYLLYIVITVYLGK